MGGIFNYGTIESKVKNAGFILVNVMFGEKARSTRIVVECTNGHQYETSWPSFNGGNRCYKCGVKEAGLRNRIPVDEVYQIIESYGYEVLTPREEYPATYMPVEICCEKGHARKVTFTDFKKVPHCPKCNNYQYKYTLNETIDIFKNENYTLTSTGYKNMKEPLDCICPEGHSIKIALDSFLHRGIRCKICSGNKKYEYEEVENIFKESGCELLSKEYKDNKTLLNYICSCGERSKITLSNFLRGVRCMGCYQESKKGETSSHWNPNLSDEDRKNNRKFFEYKGWRLSVFERDKYTCQCCGDDKGGNLNAHHLDGYDWCIEKRIDVDNGITLCELCHNDFHHIYGYGDNAREQFEEYLKDILDSAS